MPATDLAPLGAPTWVELFTSKPEVSRPFYAELFGWDVVDPGPDYGGYQNFTLGGSMIAGSMVNADPAAVPDSWSVYLHVADAAASAEAVVAAGGTIHVPPMAVMDLGHMAVATDAGGAMVGLWQPGTHRGIERWGEPGTPAWYELHASDYDASVAFYRDALGWPVATMSDTPGFRYSTYGDGEGAKAGIMDAASMLAGAPPHWVVYFRVASCDDAVAEVVSLGGAELRSPEDTPYGRLASVADPTGAAFALMS